MGKSIHFTLGLIILLLVDIIWVFSSELTEALNAAETTDSSSGNYLGEPSYVPLKAAGSDKVSDGESDDSSNKCVRFSKITEVRQLSETDAVDAMLSRLSFSASIQAEEHAKQMADRLSVKEVMKISLAFCLLWFLGNYSYQVALSLTEASIVNIVSSSSGLFTMLLASIFPSSSADNFSISKLASSLLMIVGVSLISLEDLSFEKSVVPVGLLWAFMGSLLYACYMVFLRRRVPSTNKMDFTMFFGFVGLFNIFILWPGFPILTILGWEKFELPTKEQLIYMSLNGIVGTVFSELLWLWGCFLTSSLMATMSLSLTIPLTMLVDVWLKDISFSWSFYLGIIPTVASFASITVFTHFEEWDPLFDCFKHFVKLCTNRRPLYELVTDDLEGENLITSEQEDEEREAELASSRNKDSLMENNYV